MTRPYAPPPRVVYACPRNGELTKCTFTAIGGIFHCRESGPHVRIETQFVGIPAPLCDLHDCYMERVGGA